MRIKSLLNLALFSAIGMTAQAQIFSEDFSAAQTKAETDLGWYEYINTLNNDTRDLIEGACVFVNDPAATGSGWQRAIKFRNLNLVEGRVYKVSFNLWGDQTYGEQNTPTNARVGLLMGEENKDIAIMTKSGVEDQQYYSFLPAQDKTKKFTYMFYYASKALQLEKYNARTNKTGEIDPDKYFISFNIYNPGTFSLDNVVFEEAGTPQTINPVKSVKYGGGVTVVDFLWATNLIAKAEADPRGIVELPNDCITLKVNGEETDVVAVEGHKDGKLYIFRYVDTEAAEPETVTSLSVSFTNPEENGIAWDVDAEGAIANFENAAAEYDEELEFNPIVPWINAAAEVVESNPIDGSFALGQDIKEFTVKFDKNVDINWYYEAEDGTYPDGAPKAYLIDTNGEKEELTLKTEGLEPGEGGYAPTNTITYVRTKTGDLKKGQYSVSIKGIWNEAGMNTTDVLLTFEVGKPTPSKTVYTDYLDCTTAGVEYSIPAGWKLTLTKDGVTTEHNGGSGSRGFAYSNSNVAGGVYLRDWDGAPLLTYGEKEGSALTIEAGDYEIRPYSIGWKKTGSFKVALKKAGEQGEVIWSQNINVTTIDPNGSKTGNFQIDAYKVTIPETGNYVYTVELGNGSNETIAGGFKLYKYTVTEGDKLETEDLIKDNFSGVQGNYSPAAGSGWRIHRGDKIRGTGQFLSWGSTDPSGEGGPRIFDLAYKNMEGKGMYLDGESSKLTFGEFKTYEDDDLNEHDEKTLNLKAAKYQISFYSALWKAEGVKLYFNIYNQDEGITGTPVLSKEYVINTKSSGGQAGDNSVEGMKTQFFWNCPAEGKYILEWHTNGEGFVGNIKFETTASLALQYMDMLDKALVPAIEEAEKANANDKYVGETRSSLNNAITEYTNPDYHTADEYNKAMDNLAALVKKSETRRANIDAYPTSLQGVIDGLNAAKGTKFEGLKEFPIVEAAYTKYNGVDCVPMNDEDLQAAVDEMGANGQLLKNMVEYCVPKLLTKQMTELANAIVALDPPVTEAKAIEGDLAACEYVLAVADAISDDQELVSNLKTVYAAKVYDMIANEQNPFETYDADLQETFVDEAKANVSFLIQNADFYSTAKSDGKGNCPATVDDFPGWTLEVISGSIASIWTTTWGGKWPTDVKPYEDCAVNSPWGTHEYDAHQLVGKLPVLKYNVSFVGGRDGSEGDLPYIYCGEAKADITATSRDNKEATVITDVTPAVEDNYGSLTIGAHMISNATHAGFDTARLTYAGTVDTFNYAEAAEALAPFVTSIEEEANAAIEGEPVSVEYINVNGVKLTQPAAAGVTIKVAKYANGKKVVSAIVK